METTNCTYYIVTVGICAISTYHLKWFTYIRTLPMHRSALQIIYIQIAYAVYIPEQFFFSKLAKQNPALRTGVVRFVSACSDEGRERSFNCVCDMFAQIISANIDLWLIDDAFAYEGNT